MSFTIHKSVSENQIKHWNESIKRAQSPGFQATLMLNEVKEIIDVTSYFASDILDAICKSSMPLKWFDFNGKTYVYCFTKASIFYYSLNGDFEKFIYVSLSDELVQEAKIISDLTDNLYKNLQNHMRSCQ